ARPRPAPAPAGLRAAVSAAGAATVTWVGSAGPDIAGYRVTVSTPEGVAVGSPITTTADEAAATTPPLAAGRVFLIRVAPVSGTGQSRVVGAEATVAVATVQPSDVTVHRASDRSVRVAWNAPAPSAATPTPTSYAVLTGDPATPEDMTMQVVSPTARSLVVATVRPGTPSIGVAAIFTTTAGGTTFTGVTAAAVPAGTDAAVPVPIPLPGPESPTAPLDGLPAVRLTPDATFGGS
ncbi:MAG: hypothetical protein ACR2JQ_11680, partial [Mycobacteriales bacterium]